MTDPLDVPADRNLEIDLVHTAARDGDRRWLLEELAPDDFYYFAVLWRALAHAHHTGQPVNDEITKTLDELYDQAAIIGNPRRAAQALRDRRRQRDLMIAAAELHNALGRGEDPTDPLERIRELLEQAAA